MSGHIVITQHDELPDAGDVEHEKLEELLQGLIPEDLPAGFNIGIALLPEDNAFSGVNTFQTAVIENLTVTNHNEVAVNNLNVENTVISLGQGMPDEVPDSDRGLIFTASGLNPSLFWDHDQAEFRLAITDADVNITDFPDPDHPDQGGYANLRVADLAASNINSSGAINAASISVIGAVSTPEVRTSELLDGNGDDYLSTHIVPGPGVTVDSSNGILTVGRTSRIKESVVAVEPYPAGQTLIFENSENISGYDNKLIDVFVNGVMVLEGENLDYTIVSGGIIFSFALEMHDIVTITIG